MMVALDTMTLIWGIRSPVSKPGNPKQANLLEMHYRSLVLLDLLEEEKHQIVIPTVTIAELLLGVEPTSHADFVANLQRRFSCRPFDLPACELAARLWLNHRELPKEAQTPRQILKADVMIVATAKVAGAEAFYTNDPKCRALAGNAGMDGRDLPLKHPDMFRNQEIRKELGLDPS